MGLLLYALEVGRLRPGARPVSLDAARLLQALGGCAGTVLARACVRDIFPPGEAARIFAQMILVLSVSPLFAPLIGGWLLLVADWRVGLLAPMRVGVADGDRDDLSPAGKPSRLQHVRCIPCGGARLLADPAQPAFLCLCHAGPAVLLGPSMSGSTGWSHVAIDMYGISPQNFGYTFLLNGIGLRGEFADRGAVAQAIARRGFSSPAVIAVQAVAGVLALLFAWTGWGGFTASCPLPSSIAPWSGW